MIVNKFIIVIFCDRKNDGIIADIVVELCIVYKSVSYVYEMYQSILGNDIHRISYSKLEPNWTLNLIQCRAHRI